MATILLAVFAVLFFYFAWKNFDHAILTILVLLPSYLVRFSFFGLPLTALEVMILVLTLVFLIQNRHNLKDFITEKWQNKFLWPIIAFFVCATISIYVAPVRIQALGIWKAYFLEPIIFFFILSHQLKNGLKKEWIFNALGISAIAVAIVAICQKLGLPGIQFFHAVPAPYLNANGTVDRAVSFYGYPNAVGLYLGPIIIWFVNSLWQKAKDYKETIFRWSVIILGFGAIVAAQSKMAIFAVLVVSWFIAVLHKKTRLAAIGLAVVGFAVTFLFSPLRDFVLGHILLREYSGFVRTLIWKETWMMLKDHWFFGAGLDGYKTAIAPYHLKTFEIFQYPHNFIFNFWSEMGLYGLIAFLWLVSAFAWLNLKLIRKFGLAKSLLNLGLIAVMLEMLIHGLVDVPYFKNDLSVIFWTVMAVAATL